MWIHIALVGIVTVDKVHAFRGVDNGQVGVVASHLCEYGKFVADGAHREVGIAALYRHHHVHARLVGFGVALVVEQAHHIHL